jgi:tRNA1(Val) A37 N6-methylase TrmN6
LLKGLWGPLVVYSSILFDDFVVGCESVMDFLINEDESLEDLQCKGLKLIQKRKGFRFGIDAVLLANFANVKQNSHVIDLGTGTGIIPLLIYAKRMPGRIVGVEIQEYLVEMAKRSILLNSAESVIEIIEGDIKNLELLGRATFDSVTTNPPYTKSNSGIRCESIAKDISRHEILCSLEDVIRAASSLLKPGGDFAMVHKPERLIDIACLMREYKIEPKYMQFVHPYPSKKPNILLIRGVKGGGKDLKVMDPLYVYNCDGKYSDEINRIYGRGE